MASVELLTVVPKTVVLPLHQLAEGAAAVVLCAAVAAAALGVLAISSLS